MINQFLQKKIKISDIDSVSSRDYRSLIVENYGVFEWASSGTVDNVFVFSAAGGGVWVHDILDSKGVYKLSMANILAGDATDKTDILNAIFAHPDVKTVLVDAQQEVTINQVLTIPTGKTLIIEPGGSFVGIGDINGGIIDISGVDQEIDDIFAGSLSLTFDSVLNGSVQFNNFGDFPLIGKLGKVYIDLATPAAYQWDGASYVGLGGGGPSLTTVVNVNTTPYNPVYTSGKILVLIDTTGGEVTVNLPNAVGNNAEYIFKKVIGTPKVIIDPFGGQTIDSEASKEILFVNTAISIESDNSNWVRI